MTDRVENIIAPNGKLWSEIRAKKKRKTSAKRKRTQKMDRELAQKKLELWEDDIPHACGDQWCTLKHCGLCRAPITSFEDCDIDHKQSRGLGGGKRDDSWENLHLVHKRGNAHKGSMSLDAYLSKYTLEERRLICQGKPIKGKA